LDSFLTSGGGCLGCLPEGSADRYRYSSPALRRRTQISPAWGRQKQWWAQWMKGSARGRVANRCSPDTRPPGCDHMTPLQPGELRQSGVPRLCRGRVAPTPRYSEDRDLAVERRLEMHMSIGYTSLRLYRRQLVLLARAFPSDVRG